jgi:lipoyl-dependent peroxiredoxin subunit C
MHGSPGTSGANTMLGVGEKFPSYSLAAMVGTDRDPNTAFRTLTDVDFAGRWKVYFFWPLDFVLPCSTEISDFVKLDNEFQQREAQLLGASIDSEWAHQAWCSATPELKQIPFPILSDLKRELCAKLGILDPAGGVAQRATFIVNPEGVIEYVAACAKMVGRNPQEVLRVLESLQAKPTSPSEMQKPEPSAKVA